MMKIIAGHRINNFVNGSKILYQELAVTLSFLQRYDFMEYHIVISRFDCTVFESLLNPHAYN